MPDAIQFGSGAVALASDDHSDIRSAGAHAGLMSAIKRDALRLTSEPLAPGLYLVATPIGNLGDVTLRALAVLAQADVVYCEDTRHSAKLLQHFAIHAVTRPFHDHNEDAERARVLAELATGKRIALISDAGTPLISDPGFKLVRACRADSIPVFSIPGASSIPAALSSSGLPTDAFFFAGFLPPKQAARRAKLDDLKTYSGTLIFFEAPQRAAAALADMADVLGPRDAVLSRELTKLHEEHLSAPLPELAKAVAEREIKGEVVILVAPAAPAEVTDNAIEQRLHAALGSMSLKDAAKTVADALDVPKARAYALGLKIKDGGA
ncbi:MAG: 16S rRNA (cytidine(1402)-2'-O)-methyltransferase [Hyphomicrobium sp.]